MHRGTRLGGATALVSCVALGVWLQSCGVMSSSSDCTQRASCTEQASLDATVDSEADSAETSDVLSDLDQAASVDDSSALGDADAEPSPHDGGSDEGALDGAVGEEHVVQDAVAEDSAPAACVDSASENCQNGIDDNCDGKIDCADRATCGAYSCAGTVPTGWVGPVVLWTGAFGVSPPACSGGYQKAFDANAGPTGTADTCSCTCAPAGMTCSATGTFHPDQACSNAQCGGQTVTVTPLSDGGCTPITPNSCGSGGSFSMTGSTPPPSGGACQPTVTTTNGPAPSWTTSARICEWGGPIDSPGGCSSGDQCLLGPPAGFGTTFCIYQAGTPACPAAYPNGHVFYSGETDERSCGPCTCGLPSGGACAGTMNFYGADAGGCGGTPGANYVLGASCRSYPGGSLLLNPGFANASYSVSGVTCSVSTDTSPEGGVVATGPTTVCCM